MVNTIGSVSNEVKTNLSKQEKVKILQRYVNGQALKEVPDTFTSTLKGAGSSVALFEGIPLFNFILRKGKLKKINETFATDTLKKIDKVNQDAFKNIFSKDGKLGQKIKNFISTSIDSKNKYTELKSLTKQEAKAIKWNNKCGKYAEKLAKKPNSIINKFHMDKALEKTTKHANAAFEAKKSIQTVEKVVENGGKTASKLGKFGKFMKSSGAGFMLVFSGLIEGLTEVYPTFKELGKEKGMKQAGKSAIKVLGDTVGFIGGEAIGTAAGTALLSTKVGALIGSAVPGLGTVVGAAVGFVGGMLGSFVMGKITKAITGKSEREKAKEEQENQQAQDIANNDESLKELQNAAESMINAESQNGNLSEDSKIASSVLEELKNNGNLNNNPFVMA